MNRRASPLTLPLGLSLLAALLWVPALFSRTSRDNPQVLGLYSLSYALVLLVYLAALLGLAALVWFAARGAGRLSPAERWLRATTARPAWAALLALAATAVVAGLAWVLPDLFSDYSVQFGTWAAWGLGAAYLVPLLVWGLPALAAAGSLLTARGWQRGAILAAAALALGLRLVALNAPPLDTDSERQPFTLSVAQRLCAHPETPTELAVGRQWRGGVATLRILQAGPIIRAEVFPLYQWLTGQLFCAFGPVTALARLLSVAGWALGCVGLHGYVRRWHGAASARWAVLFFSALPLALYFSRAALRQSLDIGLCLVGLYAVSEWAGSAGRRWLLFAGAVLIGASVASYPTLAAVGVVVLALAHHKFGWRWLLRPELWLAGVLAAVPFVGWYALAGSNGGLLTEDGRSLTDPRYYLLWFSPEFVRLFPATIISYLTLPVGLVLTLGGLRAARASGPGRWAAVWLLTSLLMLILLDPVAAFAGLPGQQHRYAYLVPALPLAVVMALGVPRLSAWLAARQVTLTSDALAVAAAAAIFVPGLFFLRPLYAQPVSAVAFAEVLRATTQPDDVYLLLTGDSGVGYLADRNGSAYDVLRGDRALPPAEFAALLCVPPDVVAVLDPVEMETYAADQFAFLKQHYPVLAADAPGWVFDTRVPAPALACPSN